MEDKKKGIAALIIAKAKPKANEEEPREEDGMDIAVEDMMQALDERDPEMFKAALNAFLDHR